MIDFNFDEDCYGCGLCAEVCPTHAIEMRVNRDGFNIPHIITDKCIGCNKCDKFCIRLNVSHNEVHLGNQGIYAFYLSDKGQRIKSTSGGAFYAFAQSIVSEKGVVCGCVWNENMDAIIVATDKMEIVEKMRGSKYVQSTIACYAEIEAALKADHRVLFSGVPCQVAAVQRRFGDHPGLFTVALFCEGTGSQKAWHKYIDQLEKEQGSKLISAFHRKTGKYGWLSPMSEYIFASEKRTENLSFTLDEYVHNMIYGYFTCNSCYSCAFKGNQSTADILIGDYWGITDDLMKKTSNKGCSVVIVNSEKGKKLFENSTEYSEYQRITLEMAAKRNPPLFNCGGKNGLRDQCLAELDQMTFHNMVAKNCNMNTTKVKVQRLLHRLGLAGIAKRILRR